MRFLLCFHGCNLIHGGLSVNWIFANSLNPLLSLFASIKHDHSSMTFQSLSHLSSKGTSHLAQDPWLQLAMLFFVFYRKSFVDSKTGSVELQGCFLSLKEVFK